MVLLRQEIGDVLRDARRQQGRTLREVSSVARVSLGYLSEVERGQKERRPSSSHRSVGRSTSRCPRCSTR